MHKLESLVEVKFPSWQISSTRSSKIECYDTNVILKKPYPYITKKWLEGFEQVVMADKKGKIMKNVKRQTENELELIVEVLADLENNSAISLEKSALKQSVNNEL